MDTTQNENNSDEQVRDPYSEMSVSLDDLPVVGEKETKAEEKTSETKDTKEPETEKVETTEEPKEVTTEESTEIIFTGATGREYKSIEEIGKTLDESSKEGVRLGKRDKEREAAFNKQSEDLTEANNTILSMQGLVGEDGYPEAKTRAEIDDMDEETRQGYYAEKREWKTKIGEFKNKLKSAKAESEAYTKRVTAQMKETDTKMTNDTENYPEYEKTKAMRADILEKSPFLDNRPETNYLTYVMVQGLISLQERNAVKTATAQARQTAADTAGAESKTVGKTGVTQKTGTKGETLDKELGDIVSSFKGKTSGF